MSPAEFLDRQARFCLSQKANDLFFRKPLLHVQSPSWSGLDSNLRCYSNRGDVDVELTIELIFNIHDAS